MDLLDKLLNQLTMRATFREVKLIFDGAVYYFDLAYDGLTATNIEDAKIEAEAFIDAESPRVVMLTDWVPTGTADEAKCVVAIKYVPEENV